MGKTSILKIFVTYFIFFVQGEIIATQENMPESITAPYLLDRILDSQGKIKNFRCTVEYDKYYPIESRQKDIEISSKKEASEKIIQMLKNKEQNSVNREHTYQKEQLVFDNTNCCRVEKRVGSYNKDGEKIEDAWSIATWDGENSIEFVKRAVSPIPGATLNNQPPLEASGKYRHPQQQVGVFFSKALKRAIDEEENIEINLNNDGNYYIEFEQSGKQRVGIVDPSKGYSLIQDAVYKDGVLLQIYEASFRQLDEGIWFPEHAESTWYYKDGDSNKLRAKDTAKISNIIINDPSICKETFTIKLPEGTRVIDVVTGVEFVVDNPMSVKLHGVTGSQTPDEIVRESIQNMDENDPNGLSKKTNKNIFIPTIDMQNINSQPFVLDLGSGKLFHIKQKLDSEEFYNYFVKLKKGDLAWNGKLITTRDATVFTTKKESDHPLTLIQGDWNKIYQIPKDVKMPYEIIVLNKEEVYYLVSIQEIKPEGIAILLNQIKKANVNLYLKGD